MTPWYHFRTKVACSLGSCGGCGLWLRPRTKHSDAQDAGAVRQRLRAARRYTSDVPLRHRRNPDRALRFTALGASSAFASGHHPKPANAADKDSFSFSGTVSKVDYAANTVEMSPTAGASPSSSNRRLPSTSPASPAASATSGPASASTPRVPSRDGGVSSRRPFRFAAETSRSTKDHPGKSRNADCATSG